MVADLRFLWLEITGRCQLECTHCYAESGPSGTHGRMTGGDWHRVVEDAATLGVGMVQFIGGEPTLHPELPALVGHALSHGVEVEVFTNLVHVTGEMWSTFDQPGVRLATSWYSSDPAEHAAITRKPSHTRTAANIAEAVRRSVPLRVGVIGVNPGQRVDQAQRMLTDLGVGPGTIGYDDLRQVGRGVRTAAPDVSQLCGNCADGVLAISPSGDVWPCVFSRWMTVGNVLDQALADILTGSVPAARAELGAAFDGGSDAGCNPKCGPNCNPINCGPRCDPMTPKCQPKQCEPAQQFCSPNYPGPDERCEPRKKPCNPGNCRPFR